MQSRALADLRRIAEGLQQLRGSEVLEAVLRHDARQVKVMLGDGSMVLISATADDQGRPCLDVDVVRTFDDSERPQLEVHFD